MNVRLTVKRAGIKQFPTNTCQLRFPCQIVAFQFALLALPFSCALSCVSAVLLLSAVGRPFPCSDSIFIFMHVFNACFFLVLDILYFTILPCSAPPNAWNSSESKFTFLPHAILSFFLFLAEQPVASYILGDNFQSRCV